MSLPVAGQHSRTAELHRTRGDSVPRAGVTGPPRRPAVRGPAEPGAGAAPNPRRDCPALAGRGRRLVRRRGWSDSVCPVWVHRFAVLTAGATLILIFVGALVTSTGSGLAVPDWPLSFGQVFPPMV